MSEQISAFLKKNPQLIIQPNLIRNYSIKECILLSNSIDSLRQDSNFVELMIESISITKRFQKNKILFNQLKETLLIQYPGWTTEEEFLLIEKNFFDLNKKINETEVSESIVWNEIEKMRVLELEKYSSYFSKEVDVTINEDFKKKNPSLTLFLKKKTLDYLSLEMFGEVNSKIHQLFSVKKIDKSHFLNKENFINKNEIVFAYINMNRMETPKIPRFGAIFDPYLVKHHKVIDVFHKLVKSRIVFNFNEKEIIVNCDVWIGNIICEE